MRKPIEKKLSQVRINCIINLLIEQSGRVLFVAGIAAFLAVLVEKLLAYNVINQQAILGIAVVAGTVVIWLWIKKWPSKMQAALLVDERLRLHERFSTTLALAESQNPFSQAAREEALQMAGQISLEGHFPVRPTRRWYWVVSFWLTAILLFAYLPQKDLLGFLDKKASEQLIAQENEKVQAEIKTTAGIVKQAVKQLGNPELTDELAPLENSLPESDPLAMKQQAIKKLGDLSEKIKNLQNAEQMDSLSSLQQMFKQLKGSPEEFSQKLLSAMAQGDFSKAAEMLKNLNEKMAQNNLPKDQQKQLAEQLKQIAKQLEGLAEKNQEMERELEKAGLDKKLAKLDPEQLKKALEKQGLSSEKIEQLMKKASACRMAANRCSELSQAMGACAGGDGGLSGDDIEALAGQMEELGAAEEQMKLSQATLDEIERAIACLGQGMCQGLGGYGEFKEGSSDKIGTGTGGPGKGFGARDSDSSGQTATKSTKIESPSSKGPAVASYYFKDSQVKGQSRRELTEVVQAARKNASEAIDDNQIPRKYEDSVKNYFGNLEQEGNDE
ncbi:MAG: hypothetical protein JXD22_00540 [Sedimentisphaerales bacterium]|nr:hypothetical protein [Sedimentisphaerales bacterium]